MSAFVPKTVFGRLFPHFTGCVTEEYSDLKFWLILIWHGLETTCCLSLITKRWIRFDDFTVCNQRWCNIS